MNEIDERLLFGLYSWKGEKPNYRNWKLPKDPRDGTNQFNHIKDAGEIGKTVIKHLKSKCTVDGYSVEYYKDIKSLSFVPVDNLESQDIITVQKMINLAYNVKEQSQDEALKKILEKEKKEIKIKYKKIEKEIEELKQKQKQNQIDLEIEGEIKWKEEEIKFLEEDLIKVKVKVKEQLQEQLQDQNQDQNQDQLQESIPWSKLSILQKRSISGYNNELSKKILNKFAQDHKNLLVLDEEIEEELDVDGYNIKIKKKRSPNRKLSHDEREKIEIQSKRTCEDIHKYDGQKESGKTVEILLEDLLIPNGEKQMILSSIATGKTLKSNDKIIINPWNSKVKWGYFTWSLQINKVSISCIIRNSGWFFPLRIIFESHPKRLYSENIFEQIKQPHIKYLGFFLIRYILDKDKIKHNIDNIHIQFEAHKSKEQYYVMLVFRDNNEPSMKSKYFLLNFRCNYVRWGTVTEWHRFLLYEIRQLMCMKAENNKIKFYLLLKVNQPIIYNEDIEDIENIDADIKQKCKSQFEDKTFNKEANNNDNKKPFLECFEAWLHKDFYDLLNSKNISTRSDKKSLHLLVSLLSIDEIFNKLNEYNELNNKYIIIKTKIEEIECICISLKNNKEKYILFPCHFGWYDDKEIGAPDRYKKDRLCIQYGDKNNLYNIEDLCITNQLLLERDNYIENIIQSKVNVSEDFFEQNIDLDIENFLKKPQQEMQTQQQGGSVKQKIDSIAMREQTNKYLQKINKKINKVDKLSNIFDNTVKNIDFYNNLKLSKFNYYYKNSKYGANKNYTYNLNNKNKFIKGNVIKEHTNFIVSFGNSILTIIEEIFLNNILIISSTINFIDKILYIYNNININITFIVVNNGEIGSFLLLKEKYKNLKEIYFLGTTYNYNTYTNILKICDKQKFNTIIIDSNTNSYNSDITQIIGILLCNELLEYKGTFIICCLLLSIENIFYLELLYISYNLFVNHSHNFFNVLNINLNLFCYSNIKNKLSKDIENKLIDYLKNTNYNFKNKNIDVKLNINFSKKFLKYISYKWSQKILVYKENIIYEKFKNQINQNNNQTGGFLTYHNFTNSHKMNLTKIPETIDDLIHLANYNKEAMDFQYKCHWGQKKLLLSEIQFLTKVCQKLNTKSLKDYAVVYVGAAHGFHFPILYNLFPELLWLLYDPGKFSKEANKHSNKSKVKIFNMFFTDDTIKHVFDNVENKKILFISDIRLEPEEESVMLDMINQVRWGTQLNADFMYLKFKSPYYEENVNIFKTNNINDLKLDKKLINNPNLAVSSASTVSANESFLYLKGDIYLQLYPNIHSIELRIFIEKINNKYELKVYNFKKIENIMANYNSNIKNCFMCNELCNDIPLDLLLLIPGYDISLECLMEYNIVYNYYKYFLNINDKNKIVYKLYKMNRYLEILTHKQFIKCNLDTTIKTLKKYDNPTKFYNENTKLKIWKELCTLQISLAAKLQINLIKLKGNVLYSKDEIENIITYLKKFTIEKDYYILYNN